MEKESVRWRETETRMLNVSSCVHLTPLEKKKWGTQVIAIEEQRVRVKEKDEEKRLCKRCCVMNKTQTLGFIPTTPPLWCGSLRKPDITYI